MRGKGSIWLWLMSSRSWLRSQEIFKGKQKGPLVYKILESKYNLCILVVHEVNCACLVTFLTTGSLTALVYQHSITPLALPCKLLIPDRGMLVEVQKRYCQPSFASKCQCLKAGECVTSWDLSKNAPRRKLCCKRDSSVLVMIFIQSVIVSVLVPWYSSHKHICIMEIHAVIYHVGRLMYFADMTLCQCMVRFNHSFRSG